MTKYTAEDFARAEFARHVDGGIAARTATHGDYSWEDRHGFCTDTEMAADPGWRIVRDAESLTAREHLDAAWEKAYVPEDGIIPAGSEHLSRFPDGRLHTGGVWAVDVSANTRNERRLMDPPAPTRPEGAEELGDLIGEYLDSKPGVDDKGMADFLAERGVRVVTEEQP